MITVITFLVQKCIILGGKVYEVNVQGREVDRSSQEDIFKLYAQVNVKAW